MVVAWSLFDGPAPGVTIYQDQTAEIDGVAAFLREALAVGMAASEIGIFVRSPDAFDRARSAAASGNVQEGATVALMHLAKGLEFRAVVVMACDEDLLPLQSRVSEAADEGELDDIYETERQLLYVACTRARERLAISGVKLIVEKV
mgnify:CR=1 FL=1